MRKTLLITIMALALVAAGCFIRDPTAHVTGGGLVDSVYDATTANFGFNVKCEGEDGAKGHLTYHDHWVKIKGTIDDCEYHNGLKVMGDWVPQGKGEWPGTGPLVGGRFVIMGTDEGEPGTEDTFGIELWNGGDLVYWNETALRGGNIQVHEED